MAQSGTLDTSNYHADVDGLRSSLQTHTNTNRSGQATSRVLELRDITDTTDISLRSVIFIPPDDATLRCLLFEALAASGSLNATAKLEAITDGGSSIARVLPAGSESISLTSIGTGSVSSTRRRYNGGTVDRVPGLLAGTPYRLSVECTSSSSTLAMVRAVLTWHTYARR